MADPVRTVLKSSVCDLYVSGDQWHYKASEYKVTINTGPEDVGVLRDTEFVKDPQLSETMFSCETYGFNDDDFATIWARWGEEDTFLNADTFDTVRDIVVGVKGVKVGNLVSVYLVRGSQVEHDAEPGQPQKVSLEGYQAANPVTNTLKAAAGAAANTEVWDKDSPAGGTLDLDAAGWSSSTAVNTTVTDRPFGVLLRVESISGLPAGVASVDVEVQMQSAASGAPWISLPNGLTILKDDFPHAKGPHRRAFIVPVGQPKIRIRAKLPTHPTGGTYAGRLKFSLDYV